MKYLWRQWAELSPRLQKGRKKLFLIDFDGTLAAITRSPSQVVISKKNIRCLRRLKDPAVNRVCVVSGRALNDLTSFFKDQQRLVFVGNHGLEFKGVPKKLIPKRASYIRDQKALALIKQKLKAVFMFWPGIMIEDKHFSITVHYRNIPKAYSEVFGVIIQYYRERFRHHDLEWKKGKKVWEIRCTSMWDKGDAAAALSKKFKGHLPIVIGDDRTDEDMFRAMKKTGVTVRVGRKKGSSAEYYLRSIHDVTKFLEALCP